MRKLLWLVCLFVFSSAAPAEIKIFSPPDKLLTFDGIVMLQGKTEPPSVPRVQGVRMPAAADGSFSCGLVLSPGKNLVEIRSGEETKELRLLYLITYPDIETAYEGKKHWARGQIVYLSTLGIIEGNPDGNFYPANPVSRGEFATWLAKAKNLRVEKLAADAFFDVPKEHWRAPYVKAVTDNKYMQPYSNDTFGIDDPISRREAAEVAVRAEGLGILVRITPLFKDVPQEEKGAAPIYTARESGLVIGVSKDLPVYDPERALTRAEAATLVSRFALAQAGVRRLSNFEEGYTREKYCALNIPPGIAVFSVLPKEVSVRRIANLRLRAEIASRESFAPVSKVKVDLTSIGGLPDAEMFDTGAAGDETAGDGVYSLNVSFEPKESGEKTIRVTAIDRLGWEGKKEATLTIVE